MDGRYSYNTDDLKFKKINLEKIVVWTWKRRENVEMNRLYAMWGHFHKGKWFCVIINESFLANHGWPFGEKCVQWDGNFWGIENQWGNIFKSRVWHTGLKHNLRLESRSNFKKFFNFFQKLTFVFHLPSIMWKQVKTYHNLH